MAAVVLAFVAAACSPSALGPDVIPERGRIVCIGAAVFFLAIWGVFVWLHAAAYVRLEETGIAIKGLFGPKRNLPWDLVDRLEVRSDRQPLGEGGQHAVVHTSLGGRHDLELLTGQSRKITPARRLSPGSRNIRRCRGAASTTGREPDWRAALWQANWTTWARTGPGSRTWAQ
jgi:hypothetical protein